MPLLHKIGGKPGETEIIEVIVGECPDNDAVNGRGLEDSAEGNTGSVRGRLGSGFELTIVIFGEEEPGAEPDQAAKAKNDEHFTPSVGVNQDRGGISPDGRTEFGSGEEETDR